MTGILERYADLLPLTDETPRLTLGEGDTPLLRLSRMGTGLGIDLYVKVEGMNPTGSFKDRGMALAVSKAVEEGTRAVVCASTGNTSASAAAYAAASGLPCFVLLPAGHVAKGKLAQAIALGARVLAVRGNFDQALDLPGKQGNGADACKLAQPLPTLGTEERRLGSDRCIGIGT